MENNVLTILDGLNKEQKLAVTSTEGPVLIVAGAGSGKTRVLTSRIAYILDKGCPPEKIMALTFTKKAASEMKERIAGMVGREKARKLYMGTFHSIFIRFLREYASRIGYPDSFTIYDTGDSISAIKTCLKELGLDEKVYKPKDVLGRISMAKNNLVTPSAYSRNQQALQNDAAAKKPRICDIYMKYSEKCRQSGVMDYDDILLNMNILLRDNPDVLEELSSRFGYIMVDEYQDTNFSQYLILKKLSACHRNICVVGDDSQSIYAFRGAKIENILNFKKDYPDNRTFRLEQNYRSTKTIVNAANSVIARNSARIPKNCFSEGEDGEKIRLIQAYTADEEAMLIASSIVSRIQTDKAQYADFAILYRTNSQSRALEEALRRRNLPYMIYSGNSFYERAEVKDMMAYMKLAVNLNDDESFKRIVNKPARGIGDTTVSALTAAAHENGMSLFRAVYADNLETYGLKNAAVQKLRAFCDTIGKISVRTAKEDAHSVAMSLALDSGLLMFYKSDTSIEGQSRTANIEELLNNICNFRDERKNEFAEEMLADGTLEDGAEISESDLPAVTLSDYLENVSLLSAVDVDDEESGNKITLMTVHSSKGLEFPYVFIAGLEENLFPSGGSMASEHEIEEERRLFYVAVTRAMKAVTLTFSSTRMRNGKHESNSPSRFVREIDRQYIANPLPSPVIQKAERNFTTGNSYGYSEPVNKSYTEKTSYGGTRKNIIPLKHVPHAMQKTSPAAERKNTGDFEPTPVMQLKAGQRIEHSRFGFGTILEISGSVVDLKAKIEFDNFGEKLLLLKYAKIRVIPIAD